MQKFFRTCAEPAPQLVFTSLTSSEDPLVSQDDLVFTGYGSDIPSQPELEEWAASDSEDEQNPGNLFQTPQNSVHQEVPRHVRQDLRKAQRACLEQALADIEGFCNQPRQNC